MKSTLITTNLGFDRWDEIFTDKIIAAAIVDRLTFKSFIIDMNGPSYRLKATEQWINERKNTDKRHNKHKRRVFGAGAARSLDYYLMLLQPYHRAVSEVWKW